MMPPNPSEGSPSLEAIYRKHQSLVRWVLRARGMPEATLDDGVHDVFVAIARRLPERDPDVPLRTWLAGVARNVGFSHRRSVARLRSRAVRMPPPLDPPQPDELLARREAWHALSDFLDDLGPEQREVFLMVEVTGMRVAELADAMGMPANTLHSRLKVARTRFTQRFGEAGEARAGLLHRAREQGRAGPRQQRRTWAAIVASIGPAPLAAAPASGAASKAGWGLASSSFTTMTLVVGVLGAAAVAGSWMPSRSAGERPKAAMAKPAVASVGSPPGGPALESEQASLHTTAVHSAPPTGPSVASVTSAAGPPQPRPRSPRRSRSDPSSAAAPVTPASTSGADTALMRATAAVRRARDQLEQGRAREALAALDDHGGSFGDLEREHRRLELRAACRLHDASRATEAARALVRLGASLDPAQPCTSLVD